MRIRTIKPEFWRSDDIAALSIEDRLLFIGLWSYVEDNGVGRDDPQLIQCDLYPHDIFTEASVRTHGGLMRLSQRGLITRYEGPDGRKYLQVNSWDKHQKINRPSKPRFPQYNAENCTLTEGSLSPQCTLTEGSLPEQGTGNREQGRTPFLAPLTKPNTPRPRAPSSQPSPLTRHRQPRTPRSPRSPRGEREPHAAPASPTGGSLTRPSRTGPAPMRPPRRTPWRLSVSATTGNRSQGSARSASTGRPRGATGPGGARNKPTAPTVARPRAARPTTGSTTGWPSQKASTPTTSPTSPPGNRP